MNTPHLDDWSRDQPGIVYQLCRSCDARWYFQRRFCPCCGVDEPLLQPASGRGTVYSASTIYRAPTEVWRPYSPYTLLLVDAEEGFRMMAHGTPGLAIGGKVCAAFRTLAGKLVPFYESAE
jgi:uncharacterized OB-fold protein